MLPRHAAERLQAWLEMLRGLGFDLTERDGSNTHFVLFSFTKSARGFSAQAPAVPLKPCRYKKR